MFIESRHGFARTHWEDAETLILASCQLQRITQVICGVNILPAEWHHLVINWDGLVPIVHWQVAGEESCVSVFELVVRAKF